MLFPILFNGGGDVSTGTWTPAPEFGGAAVGLTTSVADGQWQRVGTFYTLTGRLLFTAKGSSTGTFKIGGLPATSIANSNAGGGLIHFVSGAASLTSVPTLRVNSGVTEVDVLDFGAVAVAVLTDANITNTTLLLFCLSYQAA